jgi:hypothetical protein
MEDVLVRGDLKKLTPNQRLSYYVQLCDSLGLNPATRPFEYLELDGKLVLYARKDCTDQLRNLRKISLSVVSCDIDKEAGVVTAKVRAECPDGRRDEACGSVGVVKQVTETVEEDRDGKRVKKTVVVDTLLRGGLLANAIMRAETKAKRRVTLSICGLGFTDESEIESIGPMAKKAPPIGEETKDAITALLGGLPTVAQLKQYDCLALSDMNQDQATHFLSILRSLKL